MTQSNNTDLLQFKVSSALKNIIGRDLITDDFIAVFELIKNSFDAHATSVRIIFEKNKLTIIDDGKGMTYADLLNKWLFVAYSAKKDGSEDQSLDEDYRSGITKKRHFAGAKGVGRFSCDRLGNDLRLITRAQGANSKFQELKINWTEFEKNPHEEFEDIKFKYSEFIVSEYEFEHGTALEISGLIENWTRSKILQLKASLEKLIHPYDGNNAHQFSILVEADHEEDADLLETDERLKVNGPVRNFIFEKLSIKTTQVIATVSANGEFLTTELIDRGNHVYKIQEKIDTDYHELKDIKFQLFYLNRSAKQTFAMAMGIRSFDFGSIFLYKNGFRVHPYGEPGEDDFKIDQRHAQGWSRTLGLRDLIGRIEIFGDNDQFKETTSRDGGLIETIAYKELVSCFIEKCFLRLEKYVVGIQWPLRDKDEDLTLINNPNTRALIAELVAKLVDSEEIKLISYNKDFLNIIDQKVKDTFPALNALKKIAHVTNDDKFYDEIQKAEAEYQKLVAAEEESRNRAEQEASARRKAELDKAKAEEAYYLERKKNLFFNATSHNNNAVMGLIHHIKITSKGLQTRVKVLSNDILAQKYDDQKFLKILSEIQLISGKILKVSELITVSDLNFKYAKHEGDLIRFIDEYIKEIQPIYSKLHISLDKVDSEKVLNFSVLEMTVLIDNLISNAIKAGAKKLQIKITAANPLIMTISDDGDGVGEKEKDHIFDLGFTTKRQGSGIGLANVKEIINGMNGEVRFVGNGVILNGACFEIVI